MSPQFKSLLGFVARTTAALVLTISLGIGTLYAQEHYTWVADDDGSWQDPDNWFPRGVPGIEAEDFVIFPDLSGLPALKKNGIDFQLVIRFFLKFDRTNWVKCFIVE